MSHGPESFRIPRKSPRKAEFWAIVAFGLALGVGHWVLIDGLGGQILGWVMGEKTQYAPGYSDAGFKQVDEGMTEPQVIELVGHPLERFQQTGYEGVWWGYARSLEYQNYRIRSVRMVDGKVAEVAGYYFNRYLIQFERARSPLPTAWRPGGRAFPGEGG